MIETELILLQENRNSPDSSPLVIRIVMSEAAGDPSSPLCTRSVEAGVVNRSATVHGNRSFLTTRVRLTLVVGESSS